MRLAVVGDIHLISDRDPYKGLHQARDFFKSAWPSFKELVDRINAESPDLVIFLGDLVDWLSPENIDFALDLIGELRAPWHVTPGKHDLAPPDGDYSLDSFRTVASRKHLENWSRARLDLSNRFLDVDGWHLLLVDNSLSDLDPAAEPWLEASLDGTERAVLFTHVPIDTPSVRSLLGSMAPTRNQKKYVLSGAPGLYDRHLRDRVSDVFSAHVHLEGKARSGTLNQHICGMGISMFDPGRKETSVASATMVTLNGDNVDTRIITVE